MARHHDTGLQKVRGTTIKQWDAVWINAQIETGKPEKNTISNGAIATLNDQIAWVGEMNALPADASQLAKMVHDVKGKWITPGLIDCHTHLIYGGNRAREFEMRLNGMTYAEIAKQGGGIQSTVNATRAASEELLLEQSLKRLITMLKQGVTTVEIKSGYGLDLETELKMLRIAKRLGELLPMTIRRTFLGAHTIPREYRDQPDRYVDLVCHDMLPKIAEEKLADAVDVFCETIAFSLSQTERIFKTAHQYGLEIKCHAEQLSDSGGAALAAKYKALSADHLEFLSEESAMEMARAGTVAVLLPSAFYFLRETQLPPIALLRKHNVPMAIATDCNPGTSPNTSLLLSLNMACTLFLLTTTEAMQGVTMHAAKALGLNETHGTLTVGKQADFAIWDIQHPSELAYYLGYNPLHALVRSGKSVAV